VIPRVQLPWVSVSVVCHCLFTVVHIHIEVLSCTLETGRETIEYLGIKRKGMILFEVVGKKF
jgi:hypothetical protein